MPLSFERSSHSIINKTRRFSQFCLNAYESKGNLQKSIGLLFELNKSYLSENILSDISTYKAWLSKKAHLTDEPIQKLASLAWDFGYFKLAYNLAELEDITDATI